MLSCAKVSLCVLGRPYLSPDDAFADYGTRDVGNLDLSEAKNRTCYSMNTREALKNGMVLATEFGTNPFKFGMAVATDAHTFLPAIEEKNSSVNTRRTNLLPSGRAIISWQTGTGSFSAGNRLPPVSPQSGRRKTHGSPL